jgi:hypothetical protein
MARKAAKATKAKTSTKAKSNGNAARKGAFNPAHKIHLLVKENPKRKGSKEAKRYARYRNGMTVAQAFEKGMNALNLSRDVERKCITVGG